MLRAQFTRQDLRYPRQLMDGACVARLCAAGLPSGWRLIEVGCGARGCYQDGHLHGAHYLDTGQLETGPFWNKVADADLLLLLQSLGIRHDTTVILYGRGMLAPARAAHLMLYAGVLDVRLVDGGLDACLNGGARCTDASEAPATPAHSFGAPFPARPDYLTDRAQLLRRLARDDASVVSIRSWAEHQGVTSGYTYIDARGDIPGARWGRAGQDGDVNSMSAYLDAALCMRPAAEIAAMWASQGIFPGASSTTFYCGTGWRASLACFHAYLMGWKGISVYDGGWLEWSSTATPAQPTACQLDRLPTAA